MVVPNRLAVKLYPIGVVRREQGDSSPNEDVRREQLLSTIELDPDLTQALDGIDGYSHIYVIYWLHEIDRAEVPLVYHAGRQADGRAVGIFATRAPLRPNPIGLSLVELVRREANTLIVRGLNALDGSPVLDIKPYPELAQARAATVTRFSVPDWVVRTNSEDGGDGD